MSVKPILIAVLLLGLAAADAPAAVQLSIRDGRVWLRADRATVAQVLAEWARVGQTQIVNGARMPEGPLSLVLEGMPEEQALEVLLRAAGGFITVNRDALSGESTRTTSRFARIVVVPGSSSPPSAPAMPPRAAEVSVYRPPVGQAPLLTASGAQHVIGPDGQPVPDDQEDAPPPRPPTGSIPPGVSPPPEEPATWPRSSRPSPVPTAPAGVARPGMIPPAPPKRPGG